MNHMKNVLRMRAGEKLEISDGDNRKYVCQVCDYVEGRAQLEILEERELDTELPSQIWLFQGLPKSDKMELVVQKAVELGAYAVVPVAAKRSVVKLDGPKAEKKVKRWNEIAKSAAKQAGRGIIPEVKSVCSFDAALKAAGSLDVILFPYELAEGMDYTRKVIEEIQPGQSVGIFIGPEGGFEREEEEKALEAGARVITLGRRILRTETAPLMVLSILGYHLEP